MWRCGDHLPTSGLGPPMGTIAFWGTLVPRISTVYYTFNSSSSSYAVQLTDIRSFPANARRLTQCWGITGPLSATLAQHYTNIGSRHPMLRRCSNMKLTLVKRLGWVCWVSVPLCAQISVYVVGIALL